MKKIMYFLSFIIVSVASFAQTPQAFKYQAVIRNASGEILANQSVGLQISIVQGDSPGTIVYTETWNVETNQFGLVSLEIGKGTVQYGTFSTIDWGTGSSWLKIAFDETGGTNYTDMGTSQLLSVPYALYSNSSANGSSQWSVNGSDIYFNGGNVGIGTGTPTKKLVIKAENPTDTLLEIQDMDGNPLMVITPTLTKFNIYQPAKGVAGGFAVGRYSGAKGAQDSSFLLVTPDSTRIYTGGTGKGISGGFAVGRYTGAKGNPVAKYFYTDGDSTRVYTGGTGKGVSGGFAVGRYTGAKGTKAGSGNYMYMVPDNYFIGDQSGEALQSGKWTGKYNTFFGYQTGMNNTAGGNNVFIGYKSGYSNTGLVSGVDTLGSRNVFLGNESGYGNTDGRENVFLGYKSGRGNTSGSSNVFLGNKSGYSNAEGIKNVFIGDYSGYTNTSDGVLPFGSFNIFIGDSAGYDNSSGYTNMFIGPYAGTKNVDGYANIFMGVLSGFNNNNGKYNLFLGYNSGSKIIDSHGNTFIGQNAGVDAVGGNNNIFIGPLSGRYQSTGDNNIYFGNSAGSGQTEFNTNQGSENIFIGTNTGTDNTTGTKNVFMGYLAGDSNQSGESNVFIGTNTGENNNFGYHNVFIGNNAGVDNVGGNYIVCIGDSAGYKNITSYSTFIGEGAGRNNTSGQRNTFVGRRAGYSNETGTQNTYLGYDAGTDNIGDFNTFVGYWAGGNNVNGSNNVFIGRRAGQGSSGSDNVFIGHFAGTGATGSNRLYIDNSTTSDPLIYGEFDTDLLHINGTFIFNSGTNSVTLPTTRGTNGYVLTTDGTGGTNWTVLDDADWTVTGADMYSSVSGNVGIGISTPASKLHVSGGDLLIGSDVINTEIFTGLKLQYNVSGEGAIMSSYNDGYGFLTFYTKESVGNPITERMRIDKNGNVGIGTAVPNQKLHIKQNVANAGIRIEHQSNTNYWETGIGLSSMNYKFLYNGTIVADITNSTGAYNVLSDKRLKQDIHEISSVLDKVMKLKPSYYHYKRSLGKGKLSMGFIAQEVEPLFPEAVTDFIDDADGIKYKGLTYDYFGVIAIKAIQEQQEIINQQAIENQNQNKEIEQLKQQILELKDLIQNK